MSTNGAPPNDTGEAADSLSTMNPEEVPKSMNGAPPNDTGEAAHPLSTMNPEEVPKRNNEFYCWTYRSNTKRSTEIHHQ